MVSFGGGGESSSRSGSWYPLGVTQTRRIARRGAGIAEPAVFEGNLSSPLAQTLYKLARGEGVKKEQEESAKIAGTPGLTAPARQSMLMKLAGMGVEAAAGTPIDVWKKLAEMLAGYLQPAGTWGKSSAKAQGSTSISYSPSSPSNTPQKSGGGTGSD